MPVLLGVAQTDRMPWRPLSRPCPLSSLALYLEALFIQFFLFDRCFASNADQPHGKLSDGRSIPLLGLGTWKHTPEQAAAAVECALDTGYKHIDCATAYSNHEAIGEVFNSKFSGGGLKREDIWITSKLFNSDHASPSVRIAHADTSGQWPNLKTNVKL